MIPAPFRYESAESVEHAVDLLVSFGDDARLLAGGHSLLPLMKLRMSVPAVLVDIGRLPELAGIRDDEDRVTIGAMTRHHDVATSPVVRQALPLLAAAAASIGDPQVRHRGTLGGALAHGDPASDLGGAALALDAVLVATGPNGTRDLPITDFFRGFYETGLQPDEILTSVRIPKPTTSGWGFQKFARRAFDWAMVGVAVSAGERPRIGLISVGPKPERAYDAEQAIAEGASAYEAARRAAAVLDPPSDQVASADYRRHLVTVLLRRALEDAVRPAGR